MARDVSKYCLSNGERVPSVTEVLKIAGCDDWSHVDPAALKVAARRGSLVHHWCEMYDKGIVMAMEAGGYASAYVQFREDTGFEPGLIEEPRVSHTFRFAGTIDRTGLLNGREVLIDLKTGAPTAAAALQTAGYALLIPHTPVARYALQLNVDGTYKLKSYTDREDRYDFMAALRITFWKLQNGMAKL